MWRGRAARAKQNDQANQKAILKNAVIRGNTSFGASRTRKVFRRELPRNRAIC
jgi:hypothetical protein